MFEILAGRRGGQEATDSLNLEAGREICPAGIEQAVVTMEKVINEGPGSGELQGGEKDPKTGRRYL